MIYLILTKLLQGSHAILILIVEECALGFLFVESPRCMVRESKESLKNDIA